MAEKKTKLAIEITTVDKATAKLAAINAKLEATMKPWKDFREQLGKLRENSGLDGVIGGLKGVGSALSGVLSKVGMIGGILGAATAGLMHVIDGYDQLGDKAEAAGVAVDTLAQLRYAAERSGSSVEQLDSGLLNLSKNMGKMRAGGGKMVSFLGTVSPALLKQLKATKSNEEAFNLLADAMVRIQDPAKAAAFAQATLGDAEMWTMLARGSKGLQELRDRYAKLAGPQGEAAAKAGEVDDSMKDLKASADGAKAALVTGLAPALKIIVERMTQWLSGNRERLAEWAKMVGEKIPGAVQKLVEWLGKAWDKVSALVDAIGGIKGVAIALGAITLAPLIGAVGGLAFAIGGAVKAMSGLKDATDAAGNSGSKLGKILGGLGAMSLAASYGDDIGRGAGKLLNRITGNTYLDATDKVVTAGAKTGRSSYTEFAELVGGGTGASDITDYAKSFGKRSTLGTDALAAVMKATRDAMPANVAVKVEFLNAPKGMRTKTESSDGVDFSTGMQTVPVP